MTQTHEFNLPPSDCTRCFHVFLVEPQDNLNIGSVARAMQNLGFSHMHLVNPKKFLPYRARITARHAAPILDGVQIHASLDSALAGMHDVIGFSSMHSDRRPARVLLDQWTLGLRINQEANIALLFGPEDTGLRLEHLEYCRQTVRIPSSAEYHSYNLAQAVLLVLYELRRVDWPNIPRENEVVPEWNLFFQLDRLLDEMMELSEFERQGTPEPIPALLKNLFKRVKPNERELKILLALVSRVNRCLRETS